MKIQLQEIIKKRRNDLGLNQIDIALACGVSEATVSRWESGEIGDMKRSRIASLAKILQISPSTIVGTDEADEIDIVFDDYFPLSYSTNLSAGGLEELLNSEPDSVVYVPIKYQRIKNLLHAFKVNGTSMNNVIQDGSIVIAKSINDISELKDGNIVVAWVEGSATIKRIYVNGNIVTLMPDSNDKNHKPIFIDSTINQVNIIGKVVYHVNPENMEEYY